MINDKRKGGRPTKSKPLNQRLIIVMSEVIDYLSRENKLLTNLQQGWRVLISRVINYFAYRHSDLMGSVN